MMNDLSHLSKLSKLMQNIESERRTLQTFLYSGFFQKNKLQFISSGANKFRAKRKKFLRSEISLLRGSHLVAIINMYF